MRFHTLIAVSAFVGVLADTNIDANQRRREAVVHHAERHDQAYSALTARSGSSTHLLSMRKTQLVISRTISPRSSSKRADDDDSSEDDEDEDTDDESGNDSDGHHFNKDSSGVKPGENSHIATLVGGIIGAVIPTLFLLFLWYWFMYRPRRQNRRRRRQQQERKNKKDTENQSLDQSVMDEEPPHYQQLFAVQNVVALPVHDKGTPAELPSPIGVYQPNPVPSTVQPDHQKDHHDHRTQHLQTTAVQSVDQPNPY
ncbi:hypothetical protein F5Y19DRAFT_457735 [Xylariaceae sp. FL1651]|nr:hypothetical protein F5Y19DRAFT_457735 [Xylariaceae sp. FL1651]